MRWILEECSFDDRQLDLIDELRKRRSTVEMHKFRPFCHEFEPPLGLIYEDKPTVYRGCINGCKSFPLQACAYPGVICNWDEYSMINMSTYLYKYMLNKPFIIMPFGVLKKVRQFELIRSSFASSSKYVFVRPVKGDKGFSGRLVDLDEWAEEVSILSGSNGNKIEDVDMVLVAAEQPIKREYRIWLLDGTPVCGANYKAAGRNQLFQQPPSEIFQYAKDVTQETRYQPDRIFALDIAETTNGLSVLEATAFSPGGLYSVELEKLVDAVELVSKEEYSIYFG